MSKKHKQKQTVKRVEDLLSTPTPKADHITRALAEKIDRDITATATTHGIKEFADRFNKEK